MNIVIIEDELRTARALASLLTQINKEIIIRCILSSVKEAVNYFQQNGEADLIFMDIQLSDGHCFDIFEEAEIAHPIIFCTAYNDYMAEAFKVNSIDYILKPFNLESLTQAINKWSSLKQHFASTTKHNSTEGNKVILNTKRSMLVFDHNRYMMLPYAQMAYFTLIGGQPAIRTMEGHSIFTEHSLTALMTLLPADLFYKINRQYILQKGAIKEVLPSYLRNLEIKLTVPVKHKLTINKNKRTDFLNWLKRQ